MGTTNGRYETEADVLALPAVRAVYDAMKTSHRRGVMAERGHRLVDEACEAAGVELGAYDHRIIGWLASFGPQECAVIAGLITRAYDAGLAVAVARMPGPFTADEMLAVFADGSSDPGPHEPHRIGDNPVCIVCGKEHGSPPAEGGQP